MAVTPFPHPNPETWHAHPSTLAYGELSNTLMGIVALAPIGIGGWVTYSVSGACFGSIGAAGRVTDHRR